MSLIGNILWFILGGFAVALMYFVSELLLSCTIIGIPFCLQLSLIFQNAVIPSCYPFLSFFMLALSHITPALAIIIA